MLEELSMEQQVHRNEAQIKLTKQTKMLKNVVEFNMIQCYWYKV